MARGGWRGGGGDTRICGVFFFNMLDSDSFHLKIQKINSNLRAVHFLVFSAIFARIYQPKRVTSPITLFPVFVALVVILEILKIECTVVPLQARCGPEGG